MGDKDTITRIARLHDVGYGFPTVNGARVEGEKARLYCVHCEVDYPCPTMALIPAAPVSAPSKDGER